MEKYQKTIRLLLCADIHLSTLPVYPENHTEFEYLGNVTRYEVFNQFINLIKTLDTQQKFDKIINLGDNIGRQVQDIRAEIIQYVTTAFNAKFDPNQLLFAIGNQEGIENYEFSLQMNHQYLQQLNQLYYPNNQHINKEQFLKFGYFAQKFNEKLVFIILNTAFYCNRSLMRSLEQEDTVQQYEFLENELSLIRENNQQSIIISHIYPGVDSLSNCESDNLVFQQQFNKVLQSYQKQILGVFVGHYHIGGIIQITNCETFAISIPSVSPISKRNPEFLALNLEFDEEQQKYNIVEINRYEKRSDGQQFTNEGSIKIQQNNILECLIQTYKVFKQLK